MSLTQAAIGIDWGTHSSKWTWTCLESDSSKIIRGQFKILRSEVRFDGDTHKIVLVDEPPPTNSIYAQAIKGKLIKDPDGLFWVGPRKRIKLTLGELVSFSLWFLVSEAYNNLCDSVGTEPDEVEVRFSLPNWVDIDEGAVGRAWYEQAARVACHIFAADRKEGSRVFSPVREEWQLRVQQALGELNISDDSEISRDHEGFSVLLQRPPYKIAEGVAFRFVAESSGAGLAGLRNEEMEAGIEENKYLRKILVVDVGAGSTDIGYVLRSIPPARSGAREALCQLPPANTCQVAGAELSRAIVDIYRSRGDVIGFDEAERLKTVGENKEWLTHPAVAEWRRTISDHVRRYVTDVADKRWLHLVPGLQVLVTGGSAVVPGLREEILAAATDALKQRVIPLDVVVATSLIGLRLEGPMANDANRLAVALGAASEDLPRLSYFPKLDPPMPVSTVRPRPSWTG